MTHHVATHPAWLPSINELLAGPFAAADGLCRETPALIVLATPRRTPNMDIELAISVCPKTGKPPCGSSASEVVNFVSLATASSGPSSLRTAACELLGSLGATQAIPRLAALAGEAGDELLQAAAGRALWSLAAPCVSADELAGLAVEFAWHCSDGASGTECVELDGNGFALVAPVPAAARGRLELRQRDRAPVTGLHSLLEGFRVDPAFPSERAVGGWEVAVTSARRSAGRHFDVQIALRPRANACVSGGLPRILLRDADAAWLPTADWDDEGRIPFSDVPGRAMTIAVRPATAPARTVLGQQTALAAFSLGSQPAGGAAHDHAFPAKLCEEQATSSLPESQTVYLPDRRVIVLIERTANRRVRLTAETEAADWAGATIRYSLGGAGGMVHINRNPSPSVWRGHHVVETGYSGDEAVAMDFELIGGPLRPAHARGVA